MIKYQVANEEEKIPSFKYDREIKVELKEKEIMIITDNIVKNSETYCVRYYVRIIKLKILNLQKMIIYLRKQSRQLLL